MLSPPEPPAGEAATDLERLLRLIRLLRSPEGCPWDREQDLGDVRAYLLEEAHEVAAALDRGDLAALGEELGDLLFQVSFLGFLLAERGGPGLGEVLEAIERKMIDRHPHVFVREDSDDREALDAEEVARRWQTRKRERSLEERPGASILDGVPETLPGLTAAFRMTQKAAGLGFDWPDWRPVLDKLEEETSEVIEAVETGSSDAVRDEIGDLLFTAVNLARHLDVDPEAALARTNLKFRGRFASVERRLEEGGSLAADQEPPDLATLERWWQEAKDREG